jgi:hypothetical protein
LLKGGGFIESLGGLTLNVASAQASAVVCRLLELLGGVDCGRVNQHDRNVILNRVNTAAFTAFQPLATRSESHRFLAERANQNVEKFLGDHTPYIVARSSMERVL